MKYIIEFPNGKHVRPETLIVNGVQYSAALFAALHGYNWRTTAHGNILYYMAESGETLSFKQSYLLRYI